MQQEMPSQTMSDPPADSPIACYLNRSSLPFISSGSLVRHVGLVQDFLDPEYYQSSEASDAWSERQPVVVTPLSCLSEWVQEEASSRKKRWRELDDDKEAMRDGEDEQMDWWPAGHLRSLPDESPILAYLDYDKLEVPRKLRLNDVVEVMGSLAVAETEALRETADSEMMTSPWTETLLKLPASDKLPRVIVQSVRLLALEDIGKGREAAAPPADADFERMRTRALDLLQHAFFSANDENPGTPTTTNAAVAAEALLMAMLAHAERKADDTPVPGPDDEDGPFLGCASLQWRILGQVEENAFSKLSNLLSEILPLVVPLGQMASAPAACIPTKRAGGKLTTSPLQLPAGATVVLSDTQLQDPVFRRLVRSHRLPYVFGGHPFEMEADWRFLVLSQGDASARPENPQEQSPPSKQQQRQQQPKADDPCTLSIVTVAPPTHEPAWTQADLTFLRTYLARCRQRSSNKPVSMASEVLERAQQAFCQRRQEQQQQVGAADLHRWLTMCRLQAWSRASQKATLADWERALVLDDALREPYV